MKNMKEKIARVESHAEEQRKILAHDLMVKNMIDDLEKKINHLKQVRFNLAMAYNENVSKHMKWDNVKIPCGGLN